jgi:hypothetical protein
MKYFFLFLSIGVFTVSCRVTVSPIQSTVESNQDKIRYDNQQLEYVTTKSASQENSPILLSDVLFEVKKQYGDVTISNIRKQSRTERGKTTYFMVFDVVKVVKQK